MKSLQKAKFISGMVIWIGIFALSHYLWDTTNKFLQRDNEHFQPADSAKDWLEQRLQETTYLYHPMDLEVVFHDWVWIKEGDRIFLEGGNKRREMGVVYAKREDPKTKNCVVHLRIYPEYRSYIGSENIFTLAQEPLNPAWVVATLMPPEVRALIQKDIEQYLRRHLDDIKDIFLPLITSSAKESYAIFQKNFPKFMEAHKEELAEHLERLKVEYMEKEAMPVIEEIIWPAILAESQEKFQPIMQEMWEVFPKAEVLWLWMYQAVPGVEKDKVLKRLKKYFSEQAVPIFKKHKEKLQEIPKNVLEKARSSEEVKEALQKIAQKILQDKELIDWLKSLAVDLYKKNEQDFQRIFIEKWQSESFQYQIRLVAGKFEPYAKKIANRILLKENMREISPGMAAVLRRQVLRKDRYYIYTLPTILKDKPVARYKGRVE